MSITKKISRSLPVMLMLIFASAVIGQTSGGNFTIPRPTGYVNDFAGVIDPVLKQELETKLTNFKESSNPTVELAVAVVNTTNGRDIFEVSRDTARAWGIGSTEQDNPGALLFIAVQDKKYFTQVSRDLEDELPDGLVGSLQRQYLVPEFRQGNFGKGISDTIDAYIKNINERRSGVPAAQTDEPSKSRSGSGVTLGEIICCVAIFFVLIIVIGTFARNKNNGGRGGGSGGSALDILPWIILSGVNSSSSSSDWGSSWDSGGSDWGGFGGGGDFGGGGAGGDW